MSARTGLSPKQDAVQQSSVATPAATVIAAEMSVPAGILDGGEIVILAVKPSAWFIPLVSWRWLVAGGLAAVAAQLEPMQAWQPVLLQTAVALAMVRLAYATLQWVTRYYVLTNRRVLRVRGVFTVELFECALPCIAGTHVVFSPAERLTRTGTIRIVTVAGGAGGQASWRTLGSPWEVHEQLRAAIDKASGRGAGSD